MGGNNSKKVKLEKELKTPPTEVLQTSYQNPVQAPVSIPSEASVFKEYDSK